MKKFLFCQIVCLLFSSISAFSQIADNPELLQMYNEDQGSRLAGNIDWEVLSRQDSLREVRVNELIAEGKIRTGKDYYRSAMIFQHGYDTIASGMAVKHMKMAIELDSTINKWLLAAAIDRDLMRRGKPQIYGTQYVKMGENTKWELYEIDTTQISDSERKYYGVESLAEQKIKERRMNLILVSTFYPKSNSIDKTIRFIKTEKKKGPKSEYNVTEEGINSFGYDLMNSNKTQEALKIFKLNTELYPNGYNTFDSYGECLMKLNRKDEGLKAYKRSLELNPNNANARSILEENK
ncbi:MAG: tetratricopeptide repeat protein [Saprospiraceae bacterium]|nr:tetratricopeptide repeat protein [Candidatus Vicinibacter affinis]